MPDSNKEREYQQICILVHHINAYCEMIYTDAVILGKSELADYLKSFVAESAEIRRLVTQIYPSDSGDPLFAQVIREEIARRLYVIRTTIDSLPQKFPRFEYAESFQILMRISDLVHQACAHFETLLNISLDNLEGVPLDDLRNASDDSLSLYLAGMTDRVHNVNAGTILLGGEPGEASTIIRNFLMQVGFHTVTITGDDEIADALDIYDVSLICYDCGMDASRSIEFLKKVADNPRFSDKPILACGNICEEEMAAETIQLGAIDFFIPGRSTRVLFSRIMAAVSHSKSVYRRQLYIRALEMNKHSTSREFATAAEYVLNQLPAHIKGGSIEVDWAFLPSIELGGDIFGYSWLSGTEFAVYLLDVSGHGLEASLYSVTIQNLLNKQLLGVANFHDPCSVLKELNSIFLMEEQNNMFFSMWYGIYNTETRQLVWSSAGLQPAVLLVNARKPELLCADSAVIGIDTDSIYENHTNSIPRGSRLSVFSDGIYELKKNDDTMMSLDEFISLLNQKDNDENCNHFVRRIESYGKTGQFEDDVSFVEIKF